MTTRVTNQMLSRFALFNVNQSRTRLVRLQEQASSGLRVNRPSDDPAAAAQALRLRADLDATAQYERNLNQARTRVAAVESAIADAQDVLVEARSIALQGASDTLGADERLQLAERVEQLHARLLTIGNTQLQGAHVFSGYASSTAPFAASGPFVEGGGSPTVSFAGDPSELELEIDEGVRERTTLDGQRVFLGDGDGNGSPDAGREDLYDVLADLRDALATDDADAVRATLDRFDAGSAQLQIERTRIGAADEQIRAAEGRLADREILLSQTLSSVQDADTVEVLSELVNEESALQATLEVTARLLQPSLLDTLG